MSDDDLFESASERVRKIKEGLLIVKAEFAPHGEMYLGDVGPASYMDPELIILRNDDDRVRFNRMAEIKNYREMLTPLGEVAYPYYVLTMDLITCRRRFGVWEYYKDLLELSRVVEIKGLPGVSPEDVMEVHRRRGLVEQLVDAAGKGQADLLRALLDDGADAGGMTGRGDSAMRVARENGHKDVIEILKAAGAKE